MCVQHLISTPLQFFSHHHSDTSILRHPTVDLRESFPPKRNIRNVDPQPLKPSKTRFFKFHVLSFEMPKALLKKTVTLLWAMAMATRLWVWLFEQRQCGPKMIVGRCWRKVLVSDFNDWFCTTFGWLLFIMIQIFGVWSEGKETAKKRLRLQPGCALKCFFLE